MPGATLLDITGVDQGSTFVWNITVKDTDGISALNLTNYLITSQIKKFFKSATVAASFTVTVVSAELGQVRLELSPATTAGLSAGTYRYDVKMVNTVTGASEKIYKGTLSVSPAVTP